MCFKTMRNEHRLEPKMQHYGCMVDILGRAGRLEEAWELIKEMPFEANDVACRPLPSACRNHGDFDMGLKVAKVFTEGGSTPTLARKKPILCSSVSIQPV